MPDTQNMAVTNSWVKVFASGGSNDGALVAFQNVGPTPIFCREDSMTPAATDEGYIYKSGQTGEGKIDSVGSFWVRTADVGAKGTLRFSRVNFSTT